MFYGSQCFDNLFKVFGPAGIAAGQVIGSWA